MSPRHDSGRTWAGVRAPAAVALLAGAAAAIGGVLDLDAFLSSYLIAWLFWLGIALGSLALLMLQHLTGGAWGLATRRILEASAGTLPLLALLFLPIPLLAGRIFPWAGDTHAEDLGHKALYLNVPFFTARAAVYFLSWILLAWLLARGSARLDRAPDPFLARRLRMLSAPGLLLYGLTMTFASFDWGMSLDPHWYSTIYGVLFVVGQGLSALSFTIVAAARLVRRDPGAGEVLAPGIFHDLGNLLLAFIMLWAYVSFSQFLLIWSGNLPEEVPWYLNRSRGGWQWVAAALAAFQFAVPFALLLGRRVKRSSRGLAAAALLVLGMRYVDLFWILAPSVRPGTLRIHALDPIVWAAIGGLWLAAFGWALGRRPLFPAEAVGPEPTGEGAPASTP